MRGRGREGSSTRLVWRWLGAGRWRGSESPDKKRGRKEAASTTAAPSPGHGERIRLPCTRPAPGRRPDGGAARHAMAVRHFARGGGVTPGTGWGWVALAVSDGTVGACSESTGIPGTKRRLHLVARRACTPLPCVHLAFGRLTLPRWWCGLSDTPPSDRDAPSSPGSRTSDTGGTSPASAKAVASGRPRCTGHTCRHGPWVTTLIQSVL